MEGLGELYIFKEADLKQALLRKVKGTFRARYWFFKIEMRLLPALIVYNLHGFVNCLNYWAGRIPWK